MARLRISSSVSLHPGSRENPLEYFEQGLYFLKAQGFDAADMPSRFFACLPENPESAIEKMLAASEKAGIRIELCHLPYNLKDDATEEEKEAFSASVLRAMDAAKMLGVDHAVVHPQVPLYPIDEYNERQQHENTLAHLAPFAARAAKIGLDVVVENMRYAYPSENVRRYCCTAEQLCSVADTLGMGICWDFGHAHVKGVLQSEWLAYMGKRIKMLHVHDNFPCHDGHLAPFMGKIDWQDAMQGLKKIGYQGLFNYEVDSYRGPANAREDFARLLVKTAHMLLDMME